VAWAFLYLFAIFSSYYMIRPIRDEAGVAGGVSNLSWLFTGTLIAMLAVNPAFAALVRRLPRIRFISIAYRFFILNLLVFVVLFRISSGAANIWVGRVFFIWTSVFNLFVVSVFWALMVDVFTSEQGKRLFGFIAAAATLGGILGAAVTANAVKAVGVPSLLICAALLIEVGVFGARRLSRLVQPVKASADRDERARNPDEPIGGSIVAGFTHALHVLTVKDSRLNLNPCQLGDEHGPANRPRTG
jgi:AAA family ATP:ADP antiporter